MDLIAKNITPAKTLQALYAAAAPQGMGWLQAKAGGLSDDEATGLLEDHEGLSRNGGSSFDYVNGRPLKIEIVTKADAVLVRRVDLFDRDAPGGDGAAQRALEAAGATVVAG